MSPLGGVNHSPAPPIPLASRGAAEIAEVLGLVVSG